VTSDLRPTGDVQVEWDIVAGCTDDTDEWDCVNEDVESHDSDTTALDATDTSGAIDEFSMANAPGDHVSTNTITLKAVIKVQGTNDEDDRVDFTLEVSGVQSGNAVCANDSGAGCDCNINGTTYTTCSFTDAAWDSLSTSDIDNLTVVMTTVNDASGMPDTTTFSVTAVEILLDYSNVAASPRVVMIGD